MTDTPTPAPLVPSQRARELLAISQAWPIGKPLINGGTSDQNEGFFAANRARAELIDIVLPQLLQQESRAERSNPGADVERLRAALEPFAQIAQRKAMLYLRPNDPIVLEAVRALAR